MTIADIEFEWDDAKNALNIEQSNQGKIDFKDAATIFLDEKRLVRQDTRFDYGEDRYQAIGLCKGREIVVVYTIREGRIRIISARKAHDHEQRTYRAVYGRPGGER